MSKARSVPTAWGPRLLAAAVAVPFLIGTASAEPPRFTLPIQCDPGKDCWIVNYPDHDPSPGVKDYACRDASYDGHKGTDFAIRDLEEMRQGVPVLAAAAGTVLGVRDGMEDVDFRRLPGGRKALEGKDCGNGVGIDHGDGWWTQYCHMRRASLKVKTGQKVEAGQTLGLVGHSGRAMFPHLHFQVMRKKAVVDPFSGPGKTDACDPRVARMWKAETAPRIGYGPSAIYNMGFSAKVPKSAAVRDGLHQDEVLPAQAPALLLWADIFRVRKGDTLTLIITGPDGEEVVSHGNVLDKTQARRFVFAGKKRKALFWPRGAYLGEVVLKRGGDGPQAGEIRARRTITIR